MLHTNDLIEIDGKHYMTTAQFAELMNVTKPTADNWYQKNLGPDRRKRNGQILYSLRSVGRWLSEIKDDDLQISLLESEKHNACADATPILLRRSRSPWNSPAEGREGFACLQRMIVLK